VTLWPCWASATAVARPPRPPPMMRMLNFGMIANYQYPDNRKRQTVSKVESFDLCWTKHDSRRLIAFQ
jgi:hypothetical protein